MSYMKLQHTLAFVVLIFATSSALCAKDLLQDIKVDKNARATWTKDGLKISRVKADKDIWLWTPRQYAPPGKLTLRVRSDGGLVRVRFAGLLTFFDATAPGKIVHETPTTKERKEFDAKGALRNGVWSTIEWTVESNRAVVLIDGVNCATFYGDYQSAARHISLVTSENDTIVVSKFEFESLKDVVMPDTIKEVGSPSDSSVNIGVPTQAPKTDAPPPLSADPTKVERPEFQFKAKPLVKNLTSISTMHVSTQPDGEQLGGTGDLIAVVNAGSRNDKEAGVGFYNTKINSTMKTSFEEAARAVQLRYPYWEAGKIEFSFGEKFNAHGGPSAGAAFALLMLSVLEGFDIDPNSAFTGDITVDWKVRPVGGVTAKVRGATLDKKTIACIPPDNEQAFVDMGVLYGPSSLYDIQVFSIATLQDAIAVARTDRSVQLAGAISEFAGLQQKLTADEKAALADPETKKALESILKQAPNHLSAKALLAVVDGTAPKALSANASLYRLGVIYSPYHAILSKQEPLNRDTLPAHLTATARKRITALRPLLPKQFVPALNDVAALIEAMDSATTAKTDRSKAVNARIDAVQARFAELFGDMTFVEKLVREGY